MNASLFPEPYPVPKLPHVMPPVAILAGGMATRLRPVTAAIPKSLVAVAGEPFVAHQLRLLSQQGLRDVVLCVGHLGAQIADFAGDGHRFGCRIRYAHDGPRLLGTGGAIRQALPLLGPSFFVLYGDSYLTAPILPVLEASIASGKPALMTILRNRGRWDASNVEVVSGKIVRYDKNVVPEAREQTDQREQMEHIDYGLSVFSAEVFSDWPDSSTFDLSEVQRRLIAEGAMAAYEVTERFYEIGSVRGLQETDDFLRNSAGMQSPHNADSASTDGADLFLMDVPG